MKLFNLSETRNLISDYDNPYVPNQIETLYNQTLREGEKTIEAYARLEAQVEAAEESAARTRASLNNGIIQELDQDTEMALKTIKEAREWISSEYMLVWKSSPQEILQVLGQDTRLRPDLSGQVDESVEDVMENHAESYRLLEELSHFESGHIANREKLMDAAWGETRDGRYSERAPEEEHLYEFIRRRMEARGEYLEAAKLVLEESDPHRRYLEELES